MKLKNSLLMLACYWGFSAAAQKAISPSAHTGMDGVRRKLLMPGEVKDWQPEKFVGIFYWTWHTAHAHHPPYVPSVLLKDHPEAIWDYKHKVWPTTNSPFFWGEPLFGFYRDTDEWVLRKHAELLAEAAVDVIIFDCTNGNFTWKESYTRLCEVYSQMRSEGNVTPRIAFMLPFGNTVGGREILQELFTDLYRPGKYQDLWFRWKGKPLIMGMPEFTNGNKDMLEFFTFRPGQPVYNKGPERKDHWGWLEIFPQHGFRKGPDNRFEQVTVGVAQNWSEEKGLTAMNAAGAFGRSYTHTKGHAKDSGAVLFGLNFQEQWDRALELDPEFVFITGWNEWIAGRFEEWQGQTNAFPDQFNQEFSRDIEPMKGGHGDNYYYQMVNNIRKFKGMKQDQAKAGKKEYTAYSNNNMVRHAEGWKDKIYIDSTGRNDIIRLQIAEKNAVINFSASTRLPLTRPDSNWMMVFIDADNDSRTGWNGYDLLVADYSRTGNVMLHRFKQHAWEPVQLIPANIQSGKVTVSVPRSFFPSSPVLEFSFKWMDNMQDLLNIWDFYLHGDAAPIGRFNYHYRANR
ncbi:hypothetical protein KJS94_11865 [Flavihumibacter rivuli]|uniref:hypothetical protein n=1 Tax=Flavihumibacter rivuli TaxID=2838156 RepID=UPI001BDE7D28|nr:hypothetical protein [Flavihumibacter rivuli]ULQ55338.1 hypothetical protein KJS94_11865 [Flavihumibacter rivuli]